MKADISYWVEETVTAFWLDDAESAGNIEYALVARSRYWCPALICIWVETSARASGVREKANIGIADNGPAGGARKRAHRAGVTDCARESPSAGADIGARSRYGTGGET